MKQVAMVHYSWFIILKFIHTLWLWRCSFILLLKKTEPNNSALDLFFFLLAFCFNTELIYQCLHSLELHLHPERRMVLSLSPKVQEKLCNLALYPGLELMFIICLRLLFCIVEFVECWIILVWAVYPSLWCNCFYVGFF